MSHRTAEHPLGNQGRRQCRHAHPLPCLKSATMFNAGGFVFTAISAKSLGVRRPVPIEDFPHCGAPGLQLPPVLRTLPRPRASAFTGPLTDPVPRLKSASCLTRTAWSLPSPPSSWASECPFFVEEFPHSGAPGLQGPLGLMAQPRPRASASSLRRGGPAQRSPRASVTTGAQDAATPPGASLHRPISGAATT